MSFSIDASELHRLASNMGKIPPGLLPEVDAVLKRGAQNLKDDLVAGAKASPHFKGMAGSISYDTKYGIGSVGYEVGPDKGRRGGALGNIFYFGTSRGGGTGDLDGPLEREAPNVERFLGDLIEGLGDRL